MLLTLNVDRIDGSVLKNNKEIEQLNIERFNAVDGQKLKPNLQLQQIFENNDFNMRAGMVGCAMSHISLYIQLLQDQETDNYLILEDDVEFTNNFCKKLNVCISQISKSNWDLFYLGHHLWKSQIIDTSYDKNIYPTLEKLNVTESLNKSMGGTGGYLISKVGARKIVGIYKY